MSPFSTLRQISIDPRQFTESELRSVRFEEKVKFFQVFETEARSHLVDYVQTYIDEKRKKPLVLKGPIGTGKSFSLVYIIHRLKEKYPDNSFIFYINDSEMLSEDLLDDEFRRVFRPFLLKHKFAGDKTKCDNYLSDVFMEGVLNRKKNLIRQMKSEIQDLMKKIHGLECKFIMVWDQINAVFRRKTYEPIFLYLLDQSFFDCKIICASDDTNLIRSELFNHYYLAFMFNEGEAKEYLSFLARTYGGDSTAIFSEENLKEILHRAGKNPLDIRMLVSEIHKAWCMENSDSKLKPGSQKDIFEKGYQEYFWLRVQNIALSHQKFITETIQNDQNNRHKFIENVYCMDRLPLISPENINFIDQNIMTLDSMSKLIYSSCPIARQFLLKKYPTNNFDEARVLNLIRVYKELLNYKYGVLRSWDWEFFFSLCLQKVIFTPKQLLTLTYEVHGSQPPIKNKLEQKISEIFSILNFNDLGFQVKRLKEKSMVDSKARCAMFHIINPSFEKIDCAIVKIEPKHLQLTFFQATINLTMKLISGEEFRNSAEIKKLDVYIKENDQDWSYEYEFIYVTPMPMWKEKDKKEKFAKIIQVQDNPSFFDYLEYKPNEKIKDV